MQLTLTPPDTVLRTGTAEHTPLARQIIDSLRQTHKLCVAALYAQYSIQLDLPPERTLASLIRKKEIRFVKDSILTFYLYGNGAPLPADTEELRQLLRQTVQNTCRQNQITPHYERLYLPQELQAYGLYQTNPAAWDTSRVIPTRPAAFERTSVVIEYVDHLVLWQRLTDALPTANRCPAVKEARACVRVGFSNGIPQYHLILPTQDNASPAEYTALSRAFVSYMRPILQANDIWKLMTEAALTPQISAYTSLSDEERFSLFRT